MSTHEADPQLRPLTRLYLLHHERLPGWPVAESLRQKRTTVVEHSQLGQHPVTSQNDPLLLLLLLLVQVSAKGTQMEREEPELGLEGGKNSPNVNLFIL